MKYQIILESNEVLADDKFEKLIKPRLEIWPTSGPNITFLYAQNLEGIRKELYEKRDELIADNDDDVLGGNDITTTFDEIADLFKL